MVRRAAGEVFGRPVQPMWLPWAATAAVAVLLSAGTWFAASRLTATDVPRVAQTDVSPPAQTPQLPASPATATPASGLVAAADPPQLVQLLDLSAPAGDMDAAWSQLFSLWDMQYQPGG